MLPYTVHKLPQQGLARHVRNRLPVENFETQTGTPQT